uniref:hypothetical protein n=1 Tax=Candidatus Profftella armatura (Diaphorina cf. continua) TaxID=2661583 RepID=UPI0019154A56|nr:hypothetical protein [Candidatus Profftella armatura (Diaphorina cf. continua)]
MERKTLKIAIIFFGKIKKNNPANSIKNRSKLSIILKTEKRRRRKNKKYFNY